MKSKYSKENRNKKKEAKAIELILEVLANDFPSIKVKDFVGFTPEKDSITGQFMEESTNIIYNFTFSKDDTKVTMQRYL